MNIRIRGVRSHSAKYLVGAFLVLLILVPCWTAFVMTVIEPESLVNQEQTMGNRILWWVAGPTILVTALFGTHWVKASRQVHGKTQEVAEQTQQTTQSDQQKREYVLEVIGLGVTLDKYRQGKLWEALQAGNPHTTIREQDPKKYNWSGLDKAGTSGGRGGDTLENGAQFTPMYYGVPVLNAGAPIDNPRLKDNPEMPDPGLAGGAVASGMAWHLFVVGPRRFDEQPDRIIDDVFAFFGRTPRRSLYCFKFRGQHGNTRPQQSSR